MKPIVLFEIRVISDDMLTFCGVTTGHSGRFWTFTVQFWIQLHEKGTEQMRVLLTTTAGLFIDRFCRWKLLAVTTNSEKQTQIIHFGQNLSENKSN